MMIVRRRWNTNHLMVESIPENRWETLLTKLRNLVHSGSRSRLKKREFVVAISYRQLISNQLNLLLK